MAHDPEGVAAVAVPVPDQDDVVGAAVVQDDVRIAPSHGVLHVVGEAASHREGVLAVPVPVPDEHLISLAAVVGQPHRGTGGVGVADVELVPAPQGQEVPAVPVPVADEVVHCRCANAGALSAPLPPARGRLRGAVPGDGTVAPFGAHDLEGALPPAVTLTHHYRRRETERRRRGRQTSATGKTPMSAEGSEPPSAAADPEPPAVRPAAGEARDAQAAQLLLRQRKVRAQLRELEHQAADSVDLKAVVLPAAANLSAVIHELIAAELGRTADAVRIEESLADRVRAMRLRELLDQDLTTILDLLDHTPPPESVVLALMVQEAVGEVLASRASGALPMVHKR